MKLYGYKTDTTHQAIIFEIGSEADSDAMHSSETEGLIVGSSEWGWLSDENGRRICAALQYFSETSTEGVERMANERFSRTTLPKTPDVSHVIDVLHLSPKRREMIANIFGEELAERITRSARARDAGVESQAESRIVGRVIAQLSAQIEILTDERTAK